MEADDRREHPKTESAEARSRFAADKWARLRVISTKWGSRLSDAGYRAYGTLLDATWGNGLATVTLDQLVKGTGWSRTKAIQTLEELLALGLIWSAREGRPGLAAQYSLFDATALAAYNPAAASRLKGLSPERQAAALSRIAARQSSKASRASRIGRTPRPEDPVVPVPDVEADVLAPVVPDVEAVVLQAVPAAPEPEIEPAYSGQETTVLTSIPKALSALLSRWSKIWPDKQIKPIAHAGEERYNLKIWNSDGSAVQCQVDLSDEPEERGEPIRRAVALLSTGGAESMAYARAAAEREAAKFRAFCAPVPASVPTPEPKPEPALPPGPLLLPTTTPTTPARGLNRWVVAMPKAPSKPAPENLDALVEAVRKEYRLLEIRVCPDPRRPNGKSVVVAIPSTEGEWVPGEEDLRRVDAQVRAYADRFSRAMMSATPAVKPVDEADDEEDAA